MRFERYALIKETEQMSESYRMDDADICVVAFGIAARVSQNAVDTAREMGIKVEGSESAGTAHEFLTWRRGLHEFIPHIFKK